MEDKHFTEMLEDQMESLDIKFNFGATTIIFAISFILSCLLSLMSVTVFVMAIVEGTLSLSVLVIQTALASAMYFVVPTFVISGEVLLKRTIGVIGLSIVGNSLTTFANSPKFIMHFNSISTDTNRRILLLEVAHRPSSKWFFLPTRLFHPLAGRIRIPIFLINNDKELLDWISRRKLT